MRSTLYSLFLLGAALGLAACDSASTEDDITAPDPLVVERVEDVAADPATGRDSTGQAISLNQFAFYSLRDGSLVLAYDAEDRSDSTSAAWDIAFQSTNVIANAANGGGIQVVEAAFEEVTEAPEEGYLDALPGGSGNSWYTYNPQTNTVTPTPGRTIVVRTPDALYAKVRIVSYYEGAPAEIDPFEDTARYYTFDYVLQPDGSRSFEDIE
jgi:hypothetical protein